MNSGDVISVRVSSVKKNENSLESDPLDKLSKEYSPNASELHKDAQSKINQINELLDEINNIAVSGSPIFRRKMSKRTKKRLMTEFSIINS